MTRLRPPAAGRARASSESVGRPGDPASAARADAPRAPDRLTIGGPPPTPAAWADALFWMRVVIGVAIAGTAAIYFIQVATAAPLRTSVFFVKDGAILLLWCLLVGFVRLHPAGRSASAAIICGILARPTAFLSGLSAAFFGIVAAVSAIVAVRVLWDTTTLSGDGLGWLAAFVIATAQGLLTVVAARRVEQVERVPPGAASAGQSATAGDAGPPPVEAATETRASVPAAAGVPSRAPAASGGADAFIALVRLEFMNGVWYPAAVVLFYVTCSILACYVTGAEWGMSLAVVLSLAIFALLSSLHTLRKHGLPLTSTVREVAQKISQAKRDSRP